MKISKLVPFGLLLAQPVVAAPPWDAVERQCVAALEQKCTEIHGANCLGWWPAAVRCTLAGLEWTRPPTPARVDQCIDYVSQKLAAVRAREGGWGHSDMISDTIRCVLGE